MNNSKEQFKADLGNPYTNPVSDKLQLLFDYMSKEVELRRQWDKEDGIDVDAPDYRPESTVMQRVMGFEKYRRAYTESMYLDVLAKNGVPKNPTLTEELDRKQREAHNAALTYLLGFKDLGKVLNLEPFYTGEEVSKESIRGMGSDNSPARKEMTDFFLDLIAQFSEYNVKEMENETTRQQVEEFQRAIRKNNHDFKVKDGGLKEYQGEIEFEEFD